MADNLKIIQENPIGNGLDGFRSFFASVCKKRSILCIPEAFEQLNKDSKDDLLELSTSLMFSLLLLKITRLLPSTRGQGSLEDDLLRFYNNIKSSEFDFDRIRPLFNMILTYKSDKLIWDTVNRTITETTPPPLTTSIFKQTPLSVNTSSVCNSSEHRKYMDSLLREELGSIYLDIPGFYEAYFGNVKNLQSMAEAVFERCKEGNNPLFNKNGWRDWPKDAMEKDVLNWLSEVVNKLTDFAVEHKSDPISQFGLWIQSTKFVQGSTAKRTLDIGLIKNQIAGKETSFQWSQVIIPGELKRNPSADTASQTWIDLAIHVREVFGAQNNRRFVLGFTLCGHLMRLWEFDRLGGISSERVDINKDGLRFVSIILGFLRMDEKELGFDPTIVSTDGQQIIHIEKNGQKESFIIDHVIKRTPCIAGRGTTCWKAYQKDNPRQPFIIKDSWQFPERDEEGEFFRMVSDKNIKNVARYYHHETIQIDGKNDDIEGNVRKNLNIKKAAKSQIERSASSNAVVRQVNSSQKSRSSSSSHKRSSTYAKELLPPNKRSHSISPTRPSDISLNRVHRRIVIRDYGIPIYKASSRVALLTALIGCISGYESLHEAGLLHRDISINNLIINEDHANPSWPSFLIDLDLSAKEGRDKASGAHSRTGTKVFMAIGVLKCEDHCYMHDLESFFWVLFWICVHYQAQGKSIGPTEYDTWNYMIANALAEYKKGIISEENDFLNTATMHFTAYYKPLIQWVNKLRKVVFPNGKKWKRPNRNLYSQMKDILREACKDPKVADMSDLP